MEFNRFTKSAIVKEFPFMGDLFSKFTPEEVFIKRIDEEFLQSIPTSYSWLGSMVSLSSGTQIYFILNDGTILSNCVVQSYEHGSNYAHSDTSTGEGETILHSIERHGVKETLAYIVARVYGIHTEDHSSYGCQFVIRKPGKGFSIPDLIVAAYKAAAERVAVESDL
uniref:Uncharacterized protein n=1 Tax=viral metagenome TaxID=1070528 RepID=A0A6M3JPZ3_9ZZZZ